MSKKFKSQASSARAASGFGGFGGFQTAASPLSYITEQPDLSQISDPNVVVAFKNLSKKDSTTKAKALDDLVESLRSNADIHVLTAWADLYPRTSIDNSQIVRRNAHILQGLLTQNAGKNIVPLLSKIVPSWLAGTFDSDKSVARAASEALDKSFTTPEKKAALWKVYKDAVYERVEDALLTQTSTTLSDERSTSADEAETKYVRVAGTGIRLLSQLITNGLENREILNEKRLWDFVYHEDSYLRNAVCGLLLTALAKDGESWDWPVLSTAFLYKGLNKSQTGSTRSYLQALCRLTEIRPTIWTSDYTAKTASSKRLLQFLRQGSQNGPPDVWALIARLIPVIPLESWKKNSDDMKNLAEAYRTGVLLERVHIDAGWESCIQVSSWLVEQIDSAEDRDIFLEQNVSPLVLSHVTKSNDEKWRVAGRAEKTAETAMRAIADLSNVSLERTWNSLVDSTIEKMRLSLPESSKDFRTSQDAVTAQARRLFALQQKAGTGQIPKQSRVSMLHAALDLLKSRNGKPYGAAAIVNELAASGDATDQNLKDFLESDWDKFIDSPSSEQLVSLAIVFKKPIGTTLFQSKVETPNVIKAIQYFLREVPTDAVDDSLEISIQQRLGAFDTDISRAFTISILLNPQLETHQLRDRILTTITDNLGSDQSQSSALGMLEAIAAQQAARTALLKSDYASKVTSKLLILSDSPDTTIAERASTLSSALSTTDATSISSLPIIQQQLRGEGDALSILTLTDLGLKAASNVGDASELLPSDVDWQKALKPLYDSTMQSSLSITSPLRGVVWLVEVSSPESLQVVRDREDFSVLFRIVFFVTKVFSNGGPLKSISGPKLEALYRWYPVALELINEKLTLDDANTIWLGSTSEVLLAASDILSEGTQLLITWLQSDTYVQDWLLRGSDLEAVDRETYLTALAFQRIVSQLFDVRPQEVLQTYSDSLSSIHKSDDILESSSMLSALSSHILESSSGLKMLNELLSDVTQKPAHLERIVLLNIFLAGNNSSLEKIPQQRLVFLFKSLVTNLKAIEGAANLTESLRLLASIIPFILEIYTEQWEDLVKSLNSTWEAPEVSTMHAALQVYAQLTKALKSPEVNDDLLSAMTVHRSELSNGLLHCLQLLSDSSSETDQPRAITAEFLRRQLDDIRVPEGIDLFGLLTSRQTAVRQAVYELLHRSIPSKQEQLSIDLALDQRMSQLPEELLQLISDVDDTRQYLLSWKLVFDHFPTASYRLREVYSENLKSGAAVSDLLHYLCEKLRVTSGRPLDASKFQVANYELDAAESTDQDVQWLSVHLYYLTLLYLPSLVKTWFLDQKNHIKQPLLLWTQKYISPLIVSSSISTVAEWVSTQPQDDRPIEVKTSIRSSEIVASIAVDPESPPISLSVSLPGAYPLESPAVISRSRVGVSEKNWTSWLRTFQIIIFSSGSIIEGLVAFRRNVQGALKGQSECAICYSIIGTDMQTPSKKCGTCKNMFHGVCLFKWFKSSNSSSCPLCRNNFNYA